MVGTVVPALGEDGMAAPLGFVEKIYQANHLRCSGTEKEKGARYVVAGIAFGRQ